MVLRLDGGYTVAHDGQTERRNVVVCNEFGHGEDAAAMDIEQAIMCAIYEAGQKTTKQGSQQKAEDDGDDFFAKDSPSDEEVNDAAFVLEMAINSGQSIKASAFVELFSPVLDAGLVKTDTNVVIHKSGAIWQTMGRHDKAMIVYGYCGFFANPLGRLSATVSKKARDK